MKNVLFKSRIFKFIKNNWINKFLKNKEIIKVEINISDKSIYLNYKDILYKKYNILKQEDKNIIIDLFYLK